MCGFLVVGCYTLQPIGGTEPQVGSRVAFDVNDAGRVALGGSMGPEIAQVEGQLLQKDSEGYLIAVSNVRLLRGGEQVWTGEQVRLNTQHLGTAYGRRFSLGRSIGLGVIGVGGFAGFMASRSLLGIGAEDDRPPGGDTGQARLGRP
jgi:hypothetical protein